MSTAAYNCEAWDEGVQWFSKRTVEPVTSPLTVGYVADQVLRVANGHAEDAYIQQLIDVAVDKFEKDTGKAACPQTWQMVLSRFPYGSRPIVIPRLPLIAIASIDYIDTDGITQTLTGSPAEFLTVASGEFVRGQAVPLYGTVWPTTRLQPNAVTVTFTCGYEEDLPPMPKAGMCLLIGELYKQRSLSVQSISTSPAFLALSHFWRRVEG
jgi:uncharacterized phiE125 gp8 family phage protein